MIVPSYLQNLDQLPIEEAGNSVRLAVNLFYSIEGKSLEFPPQAALIGRNWLYILNVAFDFNDSSLQEKQTVLSISGTVSLETVRFRLWKEMVPDIEDILEVSSGDLGNYRDSVAFFPAWKEHQKELLQLCTPVYHTELYYMLKYQKKDQFLFLFPTLNPY